MCVKREERDRGEAGASVSISVTKNIKPLSPDVQTQK